MLPARPTPRRNQRRGFTLLELMIVIVVIAILAAFLVPALIAGRINVRRAAVRAEISKLEGAVGAFKSRFGSDPPSRVVLFENHLTSGSWNNSPTTDATNSLAILRQYWPDIDITQDFDWDGDGVISTSTTPIVLTQGECLVFFLGGIPRNVTSGGFSPRGFSKNPSNPAPLLSAGTPDGTRDGPFFEFDTTRLVDVGGAAGFPEYVDSFTGQTNPYLYFSSYDGSGYREATSSVSDYATTYNGVPVLAYREGSSATSPAFKSKSFQIISPGQDGQYGPGGPYVPNADVPLPGWDSSVITGWPSPSVTITAQQREVEKDNISNFSAGVLVP